MKNMYKVLATTTILAMLAAPMAASAQNANKPITPPGKVNSHHASDVAKEKSNKHVAGTLGQITNYVNDKSGKFVTVTGRGLSHTDQDEIILNITDQTKIVDSKGKRVDLQSIIDGKKVVKAFYDGKITRSIPARGTALTLVVQDYSFSAITGKVTASTDGRVTVEGTNMYTNAEETMILNIAPNAKIYDQEGKKLKKDSLKEGMNITAFFGPAVTASIPAQSTTNYITVNAVEENNGGGEVAEQAGTDGVIISKNNGSITVAGKGIDGGQNYLILHIDKDTQIVDEKGKALTEEALKADVRVDAFYGPYMALSYPAQTHAQKIIVKDQETFKIEGTIEKSPFANDSRVYVNVGSDDNTGNDLILNINKDTLLLNLQGIEDLKEGTKIVAYHSAAVTMSLPGITNAEIVMIKHEADK
ncbi:SLAP domain-containing protein [Paenibacillus sp. 1001270B_150601_E10]|uniref:SLAP domain-containing protein n=1 Tax=Paenibacillus sp. 1001270B_150601_E10 TaxID=2787079 RepID=UPI0018A00C09|nr:peptidase [Paenibacillus sp. 1001270B_150601_E10]